MKIELTPLEGLLILEPTVYEDERGKFYESWREKEYRRAGIKESFLQDNISVSRKNVLRGLHYQNKMGQLVWVTHGKIFDVAVDIRPHSPTFKHHFTIELDAEKPQQLYMPPGFAHGFYVLSDFVIIHYKNTEYYSRQDEGGILWRDPALYIKWPVEDPILSPRDSLFPLLDHV